MTQRRDLTETEQRQKEYYNRIAATYDTHHAGKHALRYRHQVLDQLLRKIPLEGKNILDAMCGGGENSFYMSERGGRLCALDISEAQCQLYQNRFPDAEVRCGSVLDTGFPEGTFDFVFTESLHHLHPHVNDGIEELHRLLKPGGYFLVWEPSAGSLFDQARRFWYGHDPKFFQENERAIDFERLHRTWKGRFDLVQRVYGGNVAHLFVQGSMAFRIPPKLVDVYARSLLSMERFFQIFQGRWNSCWILALFKKK